MFQSELESAECVRSDDTGHRIYYSNSGPEFAGWGLQWNSSPGQNVNGFSFFKLTFWVKGDVGGEEFEVGLKDTSDQEAKVESSDYVIVTKDWQQVIIPLDDFTGVNKGSVANWSLGFNASHGNGVICIDDAKFSK